MDLIYVILFILISILIYLVVRLLIQLGVRNVCILITVILVLMAVIGFIFYSIFKNSINEEDEKNKDLMNHVEEAENLIEVSKEFEKQPHNFIIASGAITKERVNIRKGPGLDYDVVATVEKGELVNLNSSNYYNEDGWFKVAYDGNGGYIYGEYLEKAPRHKEVFGSGKFGLKLSAKYLFPERNFFRKVLGFLLGIIISIVIQLIFAEHEKIGIIKLLVTFSYFIIKNSITLDNIGMGDVLSMTIMILIVTAIINFITKVVVEEIRY